LDQSQGLREEVALVVGTELLAGNGERRAGHATGEQRGAVELSAVELVDVLLDDVPVRPIHAQRLARITVDLHGGDVFESSLLEP
jgi:hypothetical protein